MLGNLILPSVISGHDPKAPGVKSDAQKQSEQAFINMNEIVEAPGGTTDGIGKVILYLKNFKHRELVNEQWLKMFADENNRPARHVMQAGLQEETFIQLDVIASLKRRLCRVSYEETFTTETPRLGGAISEPTKA